MRGKYKKGLVTLDKENKNSFSRAFSKQLFIDRGEIDGFKMFLNKLFLSETTKNLYIVVIKNYFSKKSELNLDSIMDFLKVHPRKYTRSALIYFLKYKEISLDIPAVREPVKKLKVSITREMQRNMLSELKPKLKQEEFLILEILYWTGARISEVVELRADQIKDKEIWFDVKKGGDKRKIPIVDSLSKSLNTHCEGCWKYGKIFYPDVENKYKKFIRNLNLVDSELIKDLTRTHNFRRVLTSKLVDVSGLAFAQRFMGHLNIETTVTYETELLKEKAIKKCFEVIESEG